MDGHSSFLISYGRPRVLNEPGVFVFYAGKPIFNWCAILTAAGKWCWESARRFLLTLSILAP